MQKRAKNVQKRAKTFKNVHLKWFWTLFKNVHCQGLTVKCFIDSAWFRTDHLRVWELEKSTSFSPFSNLDKSSQCLGWELRTKLFGVVLFMSIFSKSLHLVAKFTSSRAASDIVQLYWFNSRPKIKKEKKHYSSNNITKTFPAFIGFGFFSNIGHQMMFSLTSIVLR